MPSLFIRNAAGEYPNRRATSAEASPSTKNARKASYCRCRAVAGSTKKRRRLVRSFGNLIDIKHNVRHHIWCQAPIGEQNRVIAKTPFITLVFVPRRQLTDKLIPGETDKETARKRALSAPIQLIVGAKLLSQMNPLTGSASADSLSVEIQASAAIP